MKAASVILVIALMMLSDGSSVAAEKVRLIASNYSDRYHVSTCKVAQKIHADESLYFANPEEALAANLVPCKKCYPTTTSNPPKD